MNTDDADKYYWLAVELIEKDEPKEAYCHVQAALEIDPTHIESLIKAGDLLSHEAKRLGYDDHVANELAFEYFDRALVIDPYLSEAWAGKGIILYRWKRYDDALFAAEKGIAYLQLGHEAHMYDHEIKTLIAEQLYCSKLAALVALGKQEEAKMTLQDAHRLFPGSDMIKRYKAYFNM